MADSSMKMKSTDESVELKPKLETEDTEIELQMDIPENNESSENVPNEPVVENAILKSENPTEGGEIDKKEVLSENSENKSEIVTTGDNEELPKKSKNQMKKEKRRAANKIRKKLVKEAIERGEVSLKSSIFCFKVLF